MADSSEVRSGMQALLQDHLGNTVRQTLFNRMPLLYMLLGKDGDKKGVEGLGRPMVDGERNTGILISGVAAAKARKMAIMGATTYMPIVQTALPAEGDGKVISSFADNEPSRSAWENNLPSTYFKRPRFKWFTRADPYKFSVMEARFTTRAAKNEQEAWKAISSLGEAEMKSVEGVHVNYINNRIWGAAGTGSPSDEDADFWDNLHSIQSALKADNTYAGVDRSLAANSYWRGNYVTTSTQADFEALINYCNYDLALANKGLGIDCIIVGNALFKKAKAEARVKSGTVILNGGIPDFGKFGFQRELVKIDNTWIVNDPTCPSGHGAFLNLGTWTFAIHPDANFTVSAPSDQRKVEGGDRAWTGTVESTIMLACEWPAANAYFTTLV